MPWITPSLDDVRSQNRDYVAAHLHSVPLVPNSVARVLADANSGLAYLTLLYIDWLAKQLLPDTAEAEWRDRHAAIWLPGNGRKPATFAGGAATATGIGGSVLPEATQLVSGAAVLYETTAQITVGTSPTPVNVRAIDPGTAGNLDPGSVLNFVTAVPGVDGAVTIVEMMGGVDPESDDELRARVLARIQNPPMGGDASDYEQWALQVPGVTRAWCAPNEMGIGTVTLRFMCDDLRADQGGFPTGDDVAAVSAYLDTKRPVAIKDFFVLAPIPFEISFTVAELVDDSEATRADIEAEVEAMLMARAAPGVTIYASWIDEAVSQAVGEDHHSLIADDIVMPSPGHLAVLGSIIYQ